jgi:signal transduction histidine kinase
MGMFSSNEALSRVSHELRTPLNAILGFGELLSLDQLSESQRHSVEQILAGGRHLLAVVEDVLDLSRVAAGNLQLEPAPVDLEAEITETVALIGPLAAEKSLTVEVELADGPLYARADRRRLKQVLLNLISNAIKYNRPGGSITLAVAPDAEDSLRIDVRDTGAGMTRAQLRRLFVPFERLDAAVHGIDGHGLGLAMSKALTEAMGGAIEVASTPGAGSVFTVRLPAALAPTELPAALAAPALLAAA